jgi:hypothetical protein
MTAKARRWQEEEVIPIFTLGNTVDFVPVAPVELLHTRRAH